MADTAIDIRNLQKVYRLYDKPLYRLLDMFGLLFKKGGYSEHPALSDVNLKVKRGEKVAVIGRNGAGKSTLLKIISKVLAPTTGETVINGTVHALLSIGTGFHGDFTGRENIYAYLANLGISGKDAERKAAEIIDFAEIDEFIDQPVSTYSTGMGVRLMFAASTAITPEILIVDEVLGVGDAYFVQKSLNHIRQLCAEEGTTLLLVSHDIYTAAQICDRVVWIDRGRVFQDGPAVEVIRAYEASIRLQEEARVRKRVLKRRERRKQGGEPVFFQIVPKNRATQHLGMTVKAIRLLDNGEVIDQVDMESGQADCGNLLMDEGEGNWGPPYESHGKVVRDFLPYGSVNQRAPFLLQMPEGRDNLVLEISCDTPEHEQFFLEGYRLQGNTICCPLPQGAGTATMIPLAFKSDSESEPGRVLGLKSLSDIIVSGERIGSKELVVRNVSIRDGHGEEKFSFRPGEAASIDFTIQVQDPGFSGTPEIMVAVLKDKVVPLTRWVFDYVHMDGTQKNEYHCVLPLASIPFAPGTFSLSIGLYRKGYYENRQDTHYASSQDVFDFYKNIFEFVVVGSDRLYDGVNFICPAKLIVDGQ